MKYVIWTIPVLLCVSCNLTGGGGDAWIELFNGNDLTG